KEDGIFISQDKYVAEILKKFNFLSVKITSTLIETQKPLVKDEEAADVDVYFYRRLISWQCKKQTIMAISTTEAEYVAAAHCYGQVLWIQNQLLDYGDAYEKKLIQALKIHTDDNVVGLLTKAFDEKTALAKDFSNPFTLIIYQKLYGFQLTMPHSKELDSPKQTALGVNTPRCDEDSLELKKLMVLFVPICVKKDRVGVNGGDLQSKLQSKNLLLYALTASPTIHTSCIQLFWSKAKVKIVNDEVRVQALIDAKRVNINESSIRYTLKLDDEEGTSCLANDEIYTGLANMGYEKTSDKLTFYKAFFSP
nr:putative ribonuclease H-like domain-containing protein [Tanacetum cinerariifolium]